MMKTNKSTIPLFPGDELDKISAWLKRHKLTVAVAESVTSGFLQACLSSAPGAMEFYQGGITTYNLGQKARHLHINPVRAEEDNCVSAAIALDMARAAIRLFSSEIGIGITGYASPDAEAGVKAPFAFMAIVKNNEVLVNKKIISHKKQPLNVQLDYIEQIILLLKRSLVV